MTDLRTAAQQALEAMLIPSVLVWLSVGFVLWNWNPETWAEGARFIFVGFSFVLTIPPAVVICEENT